MRDRGVDQKLGSVDSMAESCQIPTGGRHQLTNLEHAGSTSCIWYFISVSFLPVSFFSFDFFKLSIHCNKRNLCGFSSSRPAVRALPSKHMFEHMMKRHDVLFVYVGGESPLKVSAIRADPSMNQELSFILSTSSEQCASTAPTLNTKSRFCATPCTDWACTAVQHWFIESFCANAERPRFAFLQEKYNDVASELIVYTYFFSASEEVLPEVTLRIWILFCFLNALCNGFLKDIAILQSFIAYYWSS